MFPDLSEWELRQLDYRVNPRVRGYIKEGEEEQNPREVRQGPLSHLETDQNCKGAGLGGHNRLANTAYK